MIIEYDRCELCGEPMPDEHQTAEFAVKAGTATAHKSCLYQLMLGIWDETVWRGKRGIDLDAPYDSKHIANPAVRKALRLDVDPATRLSEDYMQKGGEALVDLFKHDEDGFYELVERAYERDMKHPVELIDKRF
jgi:hypothetical protein